MTFNKIKNYLVKISLTEISLRSNILPTIQSLVSYYYIVLPILAFHFLTNLLEQKTNFEPIWSVKWLNYTGWDYETNIILFKLVFIFVSLLGALFYRKFYIRVLVFIMIWQVHALESSFGTFNHQWYSWMYTSLFMAFIPNLWASSVSVEKVRKSLLLIWSAQAFIMLTYTMAGLHKFVMVYLQYTKGEIHGLSQLAFLYQAANFVSDLQQPAYLLKYIIEYPNVAWLAYVSLNFLQLFALWTMIRPSLQLTWAITFVLFHTATYLTMGISFHQHILLVCVLLLGSPFAIHQLKLSQWVNDLPLVGQVIDATRYLIKRKNKKGNVVETQVT